MDCSKYLDYETDHTGRVQIPYYIEGDRENSPDVKGPF
jgi:hypothetical protein